MLPTTLATAAGTSLVRTLSFLDLDNQVTSHGATWLDRARPGTGLGKSDAAGTSRVRPGGRVVDMGYALRVPNGTERAPRDILQRLEQAEVARVGRRMAAGRGLSFIQARTGEYVAGRLAGVANLASGRFAMIDDGTGFQLVPWQLASTGASVSTSPASPATAVASSRASLEEGRNRQTGHRD